jgi:hypothetical protein
MMGGKMEKPDSKLRQTAAWAGILGPLLFVGIFTLEGFLRSGYDPMKMYISALSLGPRGWIQIANFIMIGLSIFAFSRGIAAEFKSGPASRGGLITLGVMAALFVVSGFFVMDPADTPSTQLSFRGTVHGLAGGIIFLLMPVCIFLYWRRFRIDPAWNSFQEWTLGLGILEAAGVLFFTAVSKIPEGKSIFADWLGLIQRTALVPFMIWLCLFAWKFRSRTRPS